MVIPLPDVCFSLDSAPFSDVMRGVAVLVVASVLTASLAQSHQCLTGPRGREPETPAQRYKRYAIEGSYWGVREISYRISRRTKRMSEDEAEKTIRRAFSVWEENTNLCFVYKPHGQAHINIVFAEGNHGDGEPFDGPGKILAHAFFPRYGGDVHFDDSEMWNPGKHGTGIDLYMVAVHEIGHSLGLKHSLDQRAVMAEFYQTYTGDGIHLHSDDLMALARLYGATGAASRARPEVPVTIPPIPDICNHPSIDAITRLGNGSLYAFKGDFYWGLSDGRILDGYPKRIEDDWPFEGNIDAIITDREGDSYVFKGSEYWLLSSEGKLVQGYPKKIRKGLTDTPDDIDAAFLWNNDHRPYFFKKDRYWKYSRFGMGKEWPKNIKAIFQTDVPSKVDAALRFSESESFLFVGTEYYKLSGSRFMRVVDGYPRSTGQDWFGCPKE